MPENWSKLPNDILQLILACLPLPDYPCFGAVCKGWQELVSPVFPMDRCPLLMYYDRQSSNLLHYYDPSSDTVFMVDSPLDLSSTKLISVSDGWLLLRRNEEFIFFKPTTGIVHYAPPIDDDISFSCITFCGDPSSHYMIFSVHLSYKGFIDITTCIDGEWEDSRHNSNIPFTASLYSSPVFHKGAFYCLGVKGNLGVYEPTEKKWTVLKKPDNMDVMCDESYLVKSGEELLAVLFWKDMKRIRVVKLNEKKMIWEVVHGLGSQSLFLGKWTSLLATPLEREMQNKVYLPRFHGVHRIINADMKLFEGRAFLLPRSCEEGIEKVEKVKEISICHCSVEYGKLCDGRSRKISTSRWRSRIRKVSNFSGADFFHCHEISCSFSKLLRFLHGKTELLLISP